MSTSFLNQNLQRCEEKHASFLHEYGMKPSILHPSEEQHLRAFNPTVSELAEELSKKSPVEPLGSGAQGEIKTLGDYEFRAETPDEWVCIRQNCLITASAAVDKNDLTLFLESLQGVEAKILNRRLEGNQPIEFQVGLNQWKDRQSVAMAITEPDRKRILFFTAANGHHLLVSKLDQAAGISCKKVLLHEIGHTMEIHLAKQLAAIQQTIVANFHKSVDFLNEVSPHYLANEATSLQQNFEVLKKAAERELPTIKVGGKDFRTETFTVEFARKISNEIFAETIRAHYLEPCMTNQKLEQTPTGWNALDSLVTTLHQEVELTRNGHLPSTPPFPKKQLEKDIPTGAIEIE